MVGIKALATHLGLSIGTVSRALNDRPDVNADTRARVLEAAEELGYVANQAGRSLRRGETGVIAFVMQTGHEITGQGDSFFMGIFDGVQQALQHHNLDLVTLLCPAQEDSQAYLERMVARGFADGFILSSTTPQDARIAYLARRGVPFVTLGRSSTDEGQAWIDVDFEAMAATAIDRLVARGHKRIAITVPHDDANLGHLFAKGAREAFTRHGIAHDEVLELPFLPNERGGHDLGGRLLAFKDRPTAIVLLNPSVTTGLYARLREAGLEPGRDIAVIGRENAQSQYLQPSLTRFSDDLTALGIALGEVLLASMPQHAEIYEGIEKHQVWTSALIEGQSDDVVLPST